MSEEIKNDCSMCIHCRTEEYWVDDDKGNSIKEIEYECGNWEVIYSIAQYLQYDKETGYWVAVYDTYEEYDAEVVVNCRGFKTHED